MITSAWTVSEARKNLPSLIKQAREGEPVYIGSYGLPEVLLSGINGPGESRYLPTFPAQHVVMPARIAHVFFSMLNDRQMEWFSQSMQQPNGKLELLPDYRVALLWAARVDPALASTLVKGLRENAIWKSVDPFRDKLREQLPRLVETTLLTTSSDLDLAYAVSLSPEDVRIVSRVMDDLDAFGTDSFWHLASGGDI